MPRWRADTSVATFLEVNITEKPGSRGNNFVSWNCNWIVTTGPETENGANASNTRDLIIYLGNGAHLYSHPIKSRYDHWYPSRTYSGSFEFATWGEHGIGNNAGTLTLQVKTTRGGTNSCYWTKYTTPFTVSYSEYWSGAGRATNVHPSPNPFESTVNFSWSAATPGINNGIEKYELYYEVDGQQKLEYSGNGLSHSMDATGIGRGKRLRARVVTITKKGDNPDSGWSGTIMRNRIPNVPTSPRVEKTSYIPGESIRVRFANNGDPDNNLAGFEVATDADTQIVGSTASAGATYVDVNTAGWEQGIRRKFRVRAYDSLGVRSAWSNYTAEVTLNTAPLSPSIAYPAAGSTVYSRRPRVLIRAGQANDGPRHILCVGQRSTAADGAYFSCGQSDSLEGGRQVIYRPAEQAEEGSQSIQARMFDSFLYSGQAERSFRVAKLSLTDPDLSPRGMKIKAAHVGELQTAANNLRAAYGLGAQAFMPVVAGATQIGNMAVITELQQGLQEVVDRINGWDGGRFGLQISWIDPAAPGGGVDAQKLRAAIEQLRSVILEV